MPIISSMGSKVGNRRGADTGGGGIVSSGLFVHLDASNPASYPGSGTTWTDLTGNGNNGTLTNGASYSSVAGGCIDLDGTNDFISIPHNPSLSAKTAASITLCTWVQFDTIANADFFGKLTNQYAFDGYVVGLNSSGQMTATTNGTGIDKRHTSASSYFSTGIWYFITFITRIVGTANTTKMYVNTTLAYQGFHGTDGYNESNLLRLGMGYFDGSTYGNMNGRMGAFYFYTRELSASEITQNFDATKSRYGY